MVRNGGYLRKRGRANNSMTKTQYKKLISRINGEITRILTDVNGETGISNREILQALSNRSCELLSIEYNRVLFSKMKKSLKAKAGRY